MPVSVNDVLAFDVLAAARVVAGGRDRERREIRSVSVIEVPVDNFVREGDLVLTTAMGVGHDPPLFAAFMRDIARSGAAAVLTALGPYAQSFPPEVIAAAEEAGLPLVEIPWQLRFSEISQAVLGRLLDEQHAVMRESLALQDRLTRLVVDGADLGGLARALAGMLARPVAITDPAGRVVARGGVASGFETRVQEAVQRHAAAGGAPLGSDLLQLPPDAGLVLAAITSGREPCGYIAAPVDSRSLLVVEQLTLQHAVTAAALCFQQRRAAEEMALRLRDDFVWSLAVGYIASPADAIARGRLLGYDLSRRYAGLYGKLKFDAGDADSRSLMEQSRRPILKAIEVAAAYQRRTVLATVVADVVVAFVEVHRPEEPLTGLVAHIVGALQSGQLALTASWGLGAVHDGFANFRQTYREARAACQIGASVRGVGSVTHISQTGAYRVLLGMGANPESRRFWEECLQKLIKYGERKGIDLLGTLETYLVTQGNISETARRLGLHRQSLLYRLRRIEELTGGSLADAQHRFALELSTRLYQLRDIAPPDPDWPARGQRP